MTTLELTTVADAMHPEVLTCPRDAPLELVAQLMATHHVHCVIVNGTANRRRWAVLSDLDLLSAGIAPGSDATAGDCAATEFLTVTPDESLDRAAQIMIEHENSHLVVVDPRSDRAVGVLSTLDVARAIAAR